MAIQRRVPAYKTAGVGLGSGTYMAKIVSVLDSTFMGRLKVTLLGGQGNTLGTEDTTYTVSYASPFFGYTPYEGMGYNNADFNDTQKSYGMWFVPPDVGVTVLCTFINGDPAKGFWFACLPASFANHMVPAIGGTTEVDLTDIDKETYNTDQPLPVGEINKRKNREEQEMDAERIKKALHPIAARFLEQGTVEDDVRGTTTSTSRRQVPNSVFGLSTPGPLDYRPGAKRLQIGTFESQSPSPVPVSRLGGTQFVMDDGDDRFQRKTAPGVGPVDYADILAGEEGLVDIPYNEYTRWRTRTGHQILMHNSEDLIYIGNSRGTSWIEMSSNGKIDIFAGDSVSIHSENDLNLRADRDVNIEAGRNINAKATAEYQSSETLHGGVSGTDAGGQENGRIQFESAFNTNILVGGSGKIDVVSGTLDINVLGDTRIKTQANMNIKSGINSYLTAGTNTEIASGSQHIEYAPSAIHMNGPQAQTADDAQSIAALITHDNIVTNVEAGWNPRRYQEGTFKSIMKRIPMHEPWALHENLAPQFTKRADTDREVAGE